jgi:hypothetical protein
MTEQTQLGDWHNLTHLDVTLYSMFWRLCKQDGKKEFSADDFRDYQLHQRLPDTQHGIGMLFAKWKWHNLIVEVGRVRSRHESNHKRKISVFKFKEAEA